MINEQRVILMTRLASYEKGEGRRNVKIGNYFRSDYIAIQVLKAVISATLAFGIVFAMYILYDFEAFMLDLYKIDLFAFARNVIIYYAAFVLGYGILTYIVCTWRYARAKKSLRIYYHNLKKLGNMYNEQR